MSTADLDCADPTLGGSDPVERHLRMLAPLLTGRLREVMAHRDQLVVSTKSSAHDLVTDADRALEELLWNEIHEAFPEDGFLGEERGWRLGPSGGTDWVIDPIDGTSNFVSGLPWACCSIGVMRAGEAVGGAIIDPYRDEVYLTAPGMAGIEVNGVPAGVALEPSLAGKLVLLEVPSGVPPSVMAPVERLVLAAGGSPRVMGSGALALAAVASGRAHAVVHAGPNAWDVAAGVALVRNGGGVALDGDGTYRLGAPGIMLAGNAAACALLQEAAAGIDYS